MKKSIILMLLVCFIIIAAQSQTSPQYWTGDGKQGITITATELRGVSLSPDEQHLLLLIQANILGIFQKYSAMTVLDQLYLENIYQQQKLSLSGIFSDEDAIRVGRLTNAHYIISGSLTKVTNNYLLDLAVTNVTSGERVASYVPRQVSLQSLKDFSAIGEACRDLLLQLGVNLNEQAINELQKTETNSTVMIAAEALAKGQVADRRGDIVEAAIFYYQAASSDPSLQEAIQRVSVASASISSGNLGFAVRNRLHEHDSWRTLVNEIKSFYSNHYPYEFRFNPDIDIKEGSIDFSNRTSEFSIPIRLAPSDEWKKINEFRKGLNTARGNSSWSFNLQKVGPSVITIDFQVVNAGNTVLATTTHTFSNLSETKMMDAILTFKEVNTDDINGLTLRINTVNGIPRERITESGVIQINISGFTIGDVRRRAKLHRGITSLCLLTNIEMDENPPYKTAWRAIEVSYNKPIGILLAGYQLALGETTYIGPSMGFLIPGENISLYSTGVFEFGYYQHWEGIITIGKSCWMTPSLNIGIMKGKDDFYFNLNYKRTWHQGTQTNAVSIGISFQLDS